MRNLASPFDSIAINYLTFPSVQNVSTIYLNKFTNPFSINELLVSTSRTALILINNPSNSVTSWHYKLRVGQAAGRHRKEPIRDRADIERSTMGQLEAGQTSKAMKTWQNYTRQNLNIRLYVRPVKWRQYIESLCDKLFLFPLIDSQAKVTFWKRIEVPPKMCVCG